MRYFNSYTSSLLVVVSMVVTGCEVDMESLESDFNEAVGSLTEEPEPELPAEEPKPPPKPTVAKEHVEQLSKIVERVQQTADNSPPFASNDPKDAKGIFYGWRYERVHDFRPRTRIDQGKDNAEKAELQFIVGTQRIRSDLGEPRSVELYFRLEFEHDGEGWEFNRGIWRERAATKELQLVRESAHYDFCEWLFDPEFQRRQGG